METLEAVKAKLVESLLKGNDEVIKALKKQLDSQSGKFRDLILLQGRLMDVKRKSIVGTISEVEKQVEINRVRESILQLINDLQQSDLRQEENSTTQQAKTERPHPKPTHQQEKFAPAATYRASIESRKKGGKYLAIRVHLQTEEHLVEYREDGLSPKLLVNGQEIERKDATANAAKILLSGFSLGLIKERTACRFTLADQQKFCPVLLELAFGLSRNFVGIKLTVNGMILINEGKV